MHALAELMDNAANFSPPTSEVHVYVEEASAGVVITIEDGGLVMGEVALQRAQQAVSNESLDLTNLSGTRLGLAVVGRLARKHGLSVSFRPSARGGTGVLLMVPQTLITQAKKEAPSVTREPAAAPLPPSDGMSQAARQRPPEPVSERSAETRFPAQEAPAPAQETTSIPAQATPRTSSDLPKRTRAARIPTSAAPEASPASPVAGSERSASLLSPEASPEHSQVAETDGGLPKRRRGQTLAAVQQRSSGGPAPTGRRNPPDRPSSPVHGSAPSAVPYRAVRRPGSRNPTTLPPYPLHPPRPARRTTPMITDDKLDWLLESLLERTPGTRHALVLSRDGLKLCRTPELSTSTRPTSWRRSAAGIQSLSHGASIEFGDGSGGVRSLHDRVPRRPAVHRGGRQGAHLAVVADEDADVGLVGHNMNELVEQLGEHLPRRPVHARDRDA